MLERLAAGLTRFSQRYVPDPFVLALLLTLLSFVAALFKLGFVPDQLLNAWFHGAGKNQGFWNLLAFGMQMCLILVTGHALASSPPLRRALNWLADRASTPARAIAVVSVSAMGLALVNWGLGLIAGALLARQVGLRARVTKMRVHYPLLAAAGYSGLMVWHGGLSGSAPLKVTLLSDLEQLLGKATAQSIGAIPLNHTLLALPNLLANAALLALVPLVLIRMQPKDPAKRSEAPEENQPGQAPESGASSTPAERLGRSKLIAFAFGALGLWTFAIAVRGQGIANLDPNLINFLFLFLGFMLHGSPAAYGRAIQEATEGCAGIILQFPFYAGIMGVLAGTGLLKSVAGAMAQVGPDALPVVSFYSAGLVNLFVPSGGGQWAVQGPILMEAALKSGVSPARMVMALAYGDQWTNMLQPFWALPLLGITKVSARDIIGYTAVLLLLGQLVFVAALSFGW